MTPEQWEHMWIDQHTHRYDSVAHAALVKSNIGKRYYRNALIKRIQLLRPRILK